MWLALVACRPGDPGPHRIAELTVEARSRPDLVLAQRFSVDASSDKPLDVVCTSPDDELERHVLRSEARYHHDLQLFGLLADTTYDCAFSAGRARAALSFTTDPLPDELPTWKLAVPLDGDGDDYVLFNENFEPANEERVPRLMIVDRQGRLRWYYASPYNASDLDASYEGDGKILYGGGYAAAPTQIDLAGDELLHAPPSSTGRAYNHEVGRLDTGEVVTFAIDTITDLQQHLAWQGFVIEVLDPTLHERTWTWRSQRGYDDGWLPYRTGGDPYHANAVSIQGDDVYVNLRNMGWLVKLSRSTGAMEWRMGPGLDFSLLNADGTPADDADWFWRPHDPEEDGDDFLFYDNGVSRPGGNSSRALELRVDQGARTATVVWQHSEPGWYEPIWGDVDRLPNGDVLILRGHCEACGEPGTAQRTEILEVEPDDDRVVWRMTMDDPEIGGYRAERIDGCAVFANQRYCHLVDPGARARPER